MARLKKFPLYSGHVTTNTTFKAAYNNGFKSAVVNVHVRTAGGSSPTLSIALKSVDPYNNAAATIPGGTLETITAAGDYWFFVGPDVQAVPGLSANALLLDNVQPFGTVGGGSPDFDLDLSLTMVD